MKSSDPLLDVVHAEIDTRPRGPLRWLIKPIRAVVFRALRPFIAQQQRVNVAIAETIGQRRVQSIEERAGVLRELRNTQAAIRAVQERVAALEVVRRSIDAPPFSTEGTFRISNQPAAGSVLSLGEAVLGGSVRDSGYRGFEDVFRGPEELISGRQRGYLKWIDGGREIVDIGCGRGEFLRLMESEGYRAVGVDPDRMMVERARGFGLRVDQGDGVSYLKDLLAGEIGTVFSSHVIEHLDSVELADLLHEAHRVLASGGSLILETVNPHAPAALKAFWVDRTHRQPVFPEVLLVLCAEAGFRDAFAYCPYGSGDYEYDRLVSGEYAVVARK